MMLFAAVVPLSVYVPYSPAHWSHWARSILTTVGTAAGLGFVIFTALMCISVFKIVFRYFL